MTETPLPDPVRTFLDAHARHDVDASAACFRPDAEVVDDGRTYRGTDEVRAFLAEAGAPFTFTSRLLRTERVDDATWVAHHRLEGDFPGGVVDLAYRFVLDDGRVARLDIAP